LDVAGASSFGIQDLSFFILLTATFVKLISRQDHGLRNSLPAQYFPELDRFYSACESESLAIVSWCLTPDTIAAMEFGEFFQIVTKTRRGTNAQAAQDPWFGNRIYWLS